MGMGNNRDYKTRERRAWNQLAKHKEIMDKLIAGGMSREEASRQALKQLEAKRRTKQPE